MNPNPHENHHEIPWTSPFVLAKSQQITISVEITMKSHGKSHVFLVFYMVSYSYGHLSVITGYKWDYTFYKWGFLITGKGP